MEEERYDSQKELPRPFFAQRPIIDASCALFACRSCRTKTGWPHQKWCEMQHLTDPDCADCIYWSVKKNKCDHPARRRGGDLK